MRLTCPNCGAEYEIADAMVPAAGRHVQCTACHTRWFVRGEGRDSRGEEQILRRLESKAPPPLRVVPVPEPEPVPPAPLPEPAPEPEPASAPAPEETPLPPPAPLRPAASPAPRAVPAKPAERPMAPAPRAQRIDLGAEAVLVPAPEPAPPSRFGRGFFTALVIFLVALAVYVGRAPLAAAVPPAAPALAAYGRFVDELRLDLRRQIAALTDRTRRD